MFCVLHAFATDFLEVQVTSFPSQLFVLETSGFVNPANKPVAIVGVAFSVQSVLSNLLGFAKLDPADVLGFTHV